MPPCNRKTYCTTINLSLSQYLNSPVWQSSTTNYQRELIESVQRRAFKIIFNSNDYEFFCAVHNVEPMRFRLDSLSRRFYRKVSAKPSDCLYSLLPRRDETVLAKLRHFKLFYFCRTNRFCNHLFLMLQTTISIHYVEFNPRKIFILLYFKFYACWRMMWE